MNYDLALCAICDDEIGYGHVMRCYALAEAAVSMGKKTIVAVGGKPPPLSWPCAVIKMDDEYRIRPTDAATVIFDYPAMEYRCGEGPTRPWLFVDALPDTKSLEGIGRNIDGFIYPHFGARPIPGFPTLYGEQWMPVRAEFAKLREKPANLKRVLMHARVPGKMATAPHVRVLGKGGWEDSIEPMKDAAKVVTPPCTLAYEALAAGRRVELVYGDDDTRRPIGNAMLDAGAAVRFGGVRVSSPPPFDANGAQRILEAIL